MEKNMKKVLVSGLVLCLLAVSGCVIVPEGHGYYSPAPVRVVYWH